MLIHGVELQVSGDMVCRQFLRLGEFEPATMEVWRQYATRGTLALDVGAYTGLFAMVAAMAGAHVVAFEPNPAVADRLALNLVSNDCLDSVLVVRKAVADKTTVLDFMYAPGTALTSAGSCVKKRGLSRKVQAVTLDSLLPSFKHRVSIIKCDVEGAEIGVLKGAVELLKKDRPVVIAEALTATEGDELIQWMAPLGYTYRYADHRNVIFTPSDPA